MEPEHQTKAAEEQKAASLKDLTKKYPKYDKTWWDAKGRKVHRFTNYNHKQETIDYFWWIGQNFKDGTVNIDNLTKSQKLALYGMSQQA